MSAAHEFAQAIAPFTDVYEQADWDVIFDPPSFCPACGEMVEECETKGTCEVAKRLWAERDAFMRRALEE